MSEWLDRVGSPERLVSCGTCGAVLLIYAEGETRVPSLRCPCEHTDAPEGGSEAPADEEADRLTR